MQCSQYPVSGRHPLAMLDLFGDVKATLRYLQRTCVLSPCAQEHGHVNQGVGFIRALANLACDLQRELTLLKRLCKTSRRWDERLGLIIAATQHQVCQTGRQTLTLVQLPQERDGLLIIRCTLQQVSSQ